MKTKKGDTQEDWRNQLKSSNVEMRTIQKKSPRKPFKSMASSYRSSLALRLKKRISSFCEPPRRFWFWVEIINMVMNFTLNIFCMHMHAHLCVCICMHAYGMYAYACTNDCACICTHMHAYVYIIAYMCMHKFMHAYACTFMQKINELCMHMHAHLCILMHTNLYDSACI